MEDDISINTHRTKATSYLETSKPETENSMCKGPEAGVHLVDARDIKEAGIADAK